MSKSHPASVDPFNNPPPKYEPSMPADHNDPNHPHNGDIEVQSMTNRKSTPSKRLIWAGILGSLFLILLATSTGLGFWYGNNPASKEVPSASSPIIVTATPITIVSTATTTDQVGIITVTKVEPVFATTTATKFVYPGPDHGSGNGKGRPDPVVPFHTPVPVDPHKTPVPIVPLKAPIRPIQTHT